MVTPQADLDCKKPHNEERELRTLFKDFTDKTKYYHLAYHKIFNLLLLY